VIRAHLCNGPAIRAQVSEDGTPPRWIVVDVADFRPGARLSSEDISAMLTAGYLRKGETVRNQVTGELWQVDYVIDHHYHAWRLVNVETGALWKHRRTWGRD
jgi:hypothetical protein